MDIDHFIQLWLSEAIFFSSNTVEVLQLRYKWTALLIGVVELRLRENDWQKFFALAFVSCRSAIEIWKEKRKEVWHFLYPDLLEKEYMKFSVQYLLVFDKFNFILQLFDNISNNIFICSLI